MSFSTILSLLPLLPLALSGVVAGTTYTISPSSHPDYCLAPASATEGSDLVLKLCDSSSDIVFTLDNDELRNTETNMCIDVRDGDDQSGTLLQMWGCYGHNSNQRFDVNGEQAKWVGHDSCFDLKDGLGEEGNQIQIWSCYTHNTNQRWTFTEAEEYDGVTEVDCDENGTPITASASASATPAPSASASATAGDNEDVDYENLPICGSDTDSDSDSDSTSDDTTSDDQSQTQPTYVRRGRGQHWQRSVDTEFQKLDRSYIPHAPNVERRSRRRNFTVIPTSTSTGL